MPRGQKKAACLLHAQLGPRLQATGREGLPSKQPLSFYSAAVPFIGHEQRFDGKVR